MGISEKYQLMQVNCNTYSKTNVFPKCHTSYETKGVLSMSVFLIRFKFIILLIKLTNLSTFIDLDELVISFIETRWSIIYQYLLLNTLINIIGQVLYMIYGGQLLNTIRFISSIPRPTTDLVTGG